MSRARWLLLCAFLAQPPAVQAAEKFVFGVLGDIPYNETEQQDLHRAIDEMNRLPLAFVLHVGDIKTGNAPCNDGMYQQRLSWFNRSRHAFVLLPGDNEWTDCDRTFAGGYDPVERLGVWRRTFHPQAHSLGEQRLRWERQGDRGEFPEFVENVRWFQRGVLFFSVHVVGSGNNVGNTSEFERRNAANLAWLEESFALAQRQQAGAIVVMMHGEPMFDMPANARKRRGYAAITDALFGATGRFAKPVLLIHGDSHKFRFNQPLRDVGVPPELPNLARLEAYPSRLGTWAGVEVDLTLPEVFKLHLPALGAR